MKTPQDPPRLIDSAATDPALRHALRLIHEDAPSLAALGALAENAERALHAEPLAKAASAAAGKPLIAKIVIGTIAGAALSYWGLPAAYQAAVQRSPAAHVAPSSAIPAQKSATLQHSTGSPAPEATSTPQSAANDSASPPPGPASDVVRTGDVSTASPPGEAHAAPQGSGTRSASAMGPGSHAGTGPHGEKSNPSASETSAASHQHPEGEAPRPLDHEPSEMDLLESAQQALAREPRRALSQLREHRSAFPRSKFAQEREVLVLEAFQRLHDTAALKDGARVFLARYPKSPHRARITKLLEDAR